MSQNQSAPRPNEENRPSQRWPLAAVAIMAVLVVSAGVLVFRTFSPHQSPSSETEPAEESPVLPLPDKPSIAVLPFTNMSDDPEQEYFSDGISEDIITDLSKISGLFVIARNSTFAYKGQAVDVAEVGRALGVQHILEGSIRKAGQKVRINAQLIDVTTGGHVWADRYDRELTDIFALQDEITREIVAALEVTLTAGESELDRSTEARAAAAEVLRTNTRFSVETIEQTLFSSYEDRPLVGRWMVAMRKAGLK